MRQGQRNNRTILQLLEKLGNKKPSDVQIELFVSLLLGTSREQGLLFNQKLTPRETSCLLLAAKGKTVEESAKLMDVKACTVRTWRTNILDKLSCRSMTQAIFKGIHCGYVSPVNREASLVARNTT
jgi:DNA-binding NarL/FixJ family response regulator